jgi:hypothetical protein
LKRIKTNLLSKHTSHSSRTKLPLIFSEITAEQY